MGVRLTDTRVKGYRYDPDGARIQRYWDTQIPGLGLEVTKTGRKVWLLRYRLGGKQKIITFAKLVDVDLDSARDQALELRALLKEGIDPKTASRKLDEATTVQQLFDLYTKSRHFKTCSPDFQNNFPSAIRRYLLPIVGDQAVCAVQRWQVKDIIDGLMENGKEGAARGVLTHCRILFEYAIDQHLRDDSPADRIKPQYTTSGKRETYLNSDEKIRAAWFYSGSIQVRGMVRWMLLTGCRRDEARLIERGHIVDGIWRVGKTKNTKPLVLPVMPMMQDVISEMTATFGTGRYLFPSTTSHAKPIPRGSWHYQLKSNAEFSAHELRHTVETGLADLGVKEESRDMVLNHVRGSTGSRYNHSEQLRMKTKALKKWHKYLKKAIYDKTE